jgi:hypothetical protein
MGVEYYLVCGECKEYIDLHKAYEFSSVIRNATPLAGLPDDFVLRGGYWESRGLWFLWKHRGHKNIDLWSDTNDDWFDLEPNLKEVFSHNEDLKRRLK